MDIQDLLKIHEEICAQGREIMKAKNHDYGSGSDDVFANFRSATYFGIEPEIGILMRINDKFMRIKTFVTKGTLKVEDEGVQDCVRDTINYIILAYGMLIERQHNKRSDDSVQLGPNQEVLEANQKYFEEKILRLGMSLNWTKNKDRITIITPVGAKRSFVDPDELERFIDAYTLASDCLNEKHLPEPIVRDRDVDSWNFRLIAEAEDFGFESHITGDRDLQVIITRDDFIKTFTNIQEFQAFIDGCREVRNAD